MSESSLYPFQIRPSGRCLQLQLLGGEQGALKFEAELISSLPTQIDPNTHTHTDTHCLISQLTIKLIIIKLLLLAAPIVSENRLSCLCCFLFPWKLIGISLVLLSLTSFTFHICPDECMKPQLHCPSLSGTLVPEARNRVKLIRKCQRITCDLICQIIQNRVQPASLRKYTVS